MLKKRRRLCLKWGTSSHRLTSPFGGTPLPPPLGRRRLWMVPKKYAIILSLKSQHIMKLAEKSHNSFQSSAQIDKQVAVAVAAAALLF